MGHEPEHPHPPHYYYQPPAPRISGTAMPHGVFLSTGTTSTAAWPSLVVTGFTIVATGLIALAPAYVMAWLLDQLLAPLSVSVAAILLQVGGASSPVLWGLGRVVANLLSFLAFLVILRATPLAAHHAAEHMTVHAIEHYGIYGWTPYVRQMPRAHRRCGSNLLSGILPAMLIGLPLLPVSPVLFILVAAAGWALRHRTGYLLQNVFTTKPPTEKQLNRGIDAGKLLLARWLRDPSPRLTTARQMWIRGLPQMVIGVAIAMYTLGALAERAHLWLDW